MAETRIKEFRISDEDYLAAQRLHLGWKARGISFTAWALGTAYVLFAVSEGRGAVGWTFGVAFSIILGLVFFLLFPLYQRRRLRAIYSEQKSLHNIFEIVFDDECVESRSESGTARVRWEEILKHKEDDRMFLLYHSRIVMRIVPKRAFENDGELNAFAEKLARARS